MFSISSEKFHTLMLLFKVNIYAFQIEICHNCMVVKNIMTICNRITRIVFVCVNKIKGCMTYKTTLFSIE